MSKVRSALSWVVVALLLAVGAVLLTANGAVGQRNPPPTAIDAGSGAPPPAVPPLARSAPVTLSIPALGLTTTLDRVGLTPDGTVQDPASFDRPSWYRPGATPGERGSAVILGHVDSYRGPAVFFRLADLRPGDAIDVTRTDGRTAHFMVTRTETVSKNDFPARAVYADHGVPELQLVTCGGEFDIGNRSYLSNVIIYSVLTDPSAAATRSG
ncbi:class F sortase [Nocardia sp. NPDC057668]|uniref:class F sortase n=1 Tax=Nocardia sp. NPDC057668 TaxID=3346202 RepID=UPI00366CEF3F